MRGRSRWVRLAEYGNLPDWLSGVGTFLAVVVALWIASSQQREERNARRAQREEHKAETRTVIDEAIKLAELVQKNAQAILDSRKEEDAGALPGLNVEQAAEQFVWLNARVIASLHEIYGLRQQMIALHSAAGNFRAFIEISRMAYEADIEYVRKIDHRKVPMHEMSRLLHDMGRRIEELQRVRAAL